jgi:hypothetical protein
MRMPMDMHIIFRLLTTALMAALLSCVLNKG